ncbi:hypothetical protein D3P05_21785 [Paracoccus siganidrum]|uniref:Uncharacterized protein n=1 Tax=Paracoccus siganidrum TaxID=1276757 RepID=A0A418ZTR9_9RHOB|nr:hypothetical protein D3P05_21785 [Paracoccus siganidrum]
MSEIPRRFKNSPQGGGLLRLINAEFGGGDQGMNANRFALHFIQVIFYLRCATFWRCCRHQRLYRGVRLDGEIGMMIGHGVFL